MKRSKLRRYHLHEAGVQKQMVYIQKPIRLSSASQTLTPNSSEFKSISGEFPQI